jgi:hypothetical protein
MPLGRIRILVVLAAATACAVADAHAQTASVSGSVIAEDTSEGITNAVVELVGRGAVLTTPDGLFRFDFVPLERYELRVSALGYESSNRIIDLRGDVELSFGLAIAPLALDSLLVRARQVDFDGRVRDPVRDVAVMDALVLTDYGHGEWTNQRGDFDIDDVLDGSALRLRVYAFGYLPADTTLVVDDDRQEIDLVRDTLVERLIAEQSARIVERAGDQLYEHREALDRDDLLRYPPSVTLSSIIDAKYPNVVTRNVFCVVIDEQQVRDDHRWHVMQNLFPQEIERMELLEFAMLSRDASGRVFMLRIYTRIFFQELIAENRPLRPAMILAFTDTCL